MSKQKVLVIDTVPLQMNGMSTVIMNYYRLCQEDVDMMFVINKEANDVFIEEFKEHNSYIYITNRNSVLKYMFELKKIIKKNKVDVVHIHGNSATMLIETLVARICKINKIIVHCHNSECGHMKLHRVLSPIFKRTYHKSIACSNLAGEWIFGKENFVVLPNGIKVEEFKISKNIRENIRAQYGLENNLVIGHVGLFNEQKNHDKLLRVFSELKKFDDRAVLICVSGDKKVPEKIKLLIKELGIEEDVLTLCECDNVKEVLQAMDVFVFTSKWEGLGIAIIEAEAAGLPCIISEQVPKDVDLTDHIKRISLDTSDRVWAEEIYHQEILEEKERCEMNEVISQTRYNIKNCKDKLLEVYRS